MNNLEKHSKSSSEIINEVKAFVEDFKNDLNSKYQESLSKLSAQASSTEAKIQILENVIKCNDDMVKKDFEVFSTKFNSTCEELAHRTHVNDHNFQGLNTNIQETNGRINNVLLEFGKALERLTELEKKFEEISHVKENRVNNLFYPIIIGLIFTIVNVVIALKLNISL